MGGASTHGAASLQTGTWWRLAAACADLRRRLPGLTEELGERWLPGYDEAAGQGADCDLPGPARVEHAAAVLAGSLRMSGSVPLHRLARQVDDLGAASVGALVEGAGSAPPARGRAVGSGMGVVAVPVRRGP